MNLSASTELAVSSNPLLEAARNMDEEALVRIFDLYSSAIYRYSLRLSGDPVEADNIVGDVFSKLLDQFASGKGPRTNLKSYLFETAYHLIVDQSRGQQHETVLDLANTATVFQADSMESRVEQNIQMQELLGAMNRCLSADEKQVILLRYEEGLKLQEIAEIMGKSLPNIKVLHHRGRKRIKKELGISEK